MVSYTPQLVTASNQGKLVNLDDGSLLDGVCRLQV